MPAQVIVVPKISPDCIREVGGLRPSSSADGGTVDGSADRLVSRLRSSSSVPSRSLTIQLLVVVGVVVGIQCFSQDRVQQRLPTLTFQFLMKDLQGFLPGQGSSASSSHCPGAADEAGQGVFRTFPRDKKKCDNTSIHIRGRNCLRTRAHGRRQLMPCRRIWSRRSGGGGCRRRLLRR